MPRSVGAITLSPEFQEWAEQHGIEAVREVRTKVREYRTIKRYGRKSPEELKRLLEKREIETEALRAAISTTPKPRRGRRPAAEQSEAA